MKIFWKSVTDKVFEYKALCKMDGSTIITTNTRDKSLYNSSFNNLNKNRKIKKNFIKNDHHSINMIDNNKLNSKNKINGSM